jgi:hypothetical protein
MYINTFFAQSLSIYLKGVWSRRLHPSVTFFKHKYTTFFSSREQQKLNQYADCHAMKDPIVLLNDTDPLNEALTLQLNVFRREKADFNSIHHVASSPDSAAI